jgi:hypothetical protein
VTDEIEAEIRSGALVALRRRAERQRKIAADWTVTGERGVQVMSGEGAVALRIAAALDEAADAIEAEGRG